MSNFIPRAYIREEAPRGYNPRIFVEKSYDLGHGFFDILPELREELNEISIWKGSDKSGANFVSWEIPPSSLNEVRALVAQKMRSEGHEWMIWE